MPDSATPARFLWTRFWYPRETVTPITEGYLYVPDGRYAAYHASPYKTLEALSNHQCLILLGEPGVGKSDTLKHSRTDAGGKRFFIDLGGLATPQEVRQYIFEHQAFQDWLRGRQDLYLLLDNFDDCQRSVVNLKDVILRELGTHLRYAWVTADEYVAFITSHPQAQDDLEPYAENIADGGWKIDLEELRKDTSLSTDVTTFLNGKTPDSRLYLRIACRAADFPETLRKGLEKIFDTVGVYVLAPLQQNDVARAANLHDLDGTAFLEEVRRTGVAPLAAVPVTLNLLLYDFKEHQTFEYQREHPFVRGGKRLCTDVSPEQRLRSHATLDPEQRFMVAARIAALMTFSKKDFAFTGDEVLASSKDLLIQDICGYDEFAHERAFTMTENDVRETLAFGIFTDRGPDRRGFLHQQYREYLAAWYLEQRKLPPNQQLQLLEHPLDRNVVTELAETAAALASINAEVYKHFLANDPGILLRGHVRNLTDEARATLVAALLKAFESTGAPGPDAAIYGLLWKVRHSGLAAQLEPYLDSDRPDDFKQFAIRSAWNVGLVELAEKIAVIALDSHEPEDTRRLAAMTAAELGNRDIRRSLSKLLEDDDPRDDFKGIVLKVLWPELIDATTLFTHLTRPQRQTTFGSYRMFLGDYAPARGEHAGFVAHLKDEDLAVALDWVAEAEGTNHSNDVFRDAADSIMFKAWRAFGEPGIAQKFSEHALRRLKGYLQIVGNARDDFEAIFRNELSQNPEKRLRLLDLLLSAHDQHFSYRSLIYGRTPLLVNDKHDVTWLLERLSHTKAAIERVTLIDLIDAILKSGNAEVRDLVLGAATGNTELQKGLGLEPIDLDSPIAKQRRETYQRNQAYVQPGPQTASEKQHADPLSEVIAALNRFEAGRLEAWEEVLYYLSMKPGDTVSTRVHDLYIETHPGWLRANKALKARILVAAKAYLEGYAAVQTSQVVPGSFSGYKAFRLLFHADEQAAHSLSTAVYRAWLPSLLEADGPRAAKLEVERFDMLREAYRRDPQATLQAANTLIRQRGVHEGARIVFEKFQEFWDENVTKAFEGILEIEGLPNETRLEVLGELLRHESSYARQLVEKRLLQSTEEARGQVTTKEDVAVVLFVCALDRGWPLLWRAIQADDNFGVAWFEQLMDRHSHLWFRATGLAEKELADFFTWVARHYPYEDDVIRSGGYQPTRRDYVVTFRSKLLEELEGKGTPEAVTELRRVQQELPNLVWMIQAVDAGTESLRNRTQWWSLPKDFLELIHGTDKRFARSSDELVEVVLESLERLEKRLQRQETPLVRFLWNVWREKTSGETITNYKPKDEESFSDWVRVQLHDDLVQRGIIVAREVEISKTERMDIDVSAFSRSPDGTIKDRLRVIIEVKGCWHPELETAMETQLLERYLHTLRCLHGIYLVGWFRSDKWENGLRDGKDQASWAAKLADQARGLSTNGYRIESIVIDATYR